VLATLHRLNFRQLGLEGFGKVGNYYARNIANLAKTSKQQGAFDLWPKLRDPHHGRHSHCAQILLLCACSVPSEAVSDKVPRIPDRDRLTERLLRYLPDDRVAIAHGDFKMDNFVRR